MTPPILETQGLSKSFGGVHAVRDVDFSVAEGELRCLIGPNGAGKSTFFKLLTGQLKPDGGDILFRGNRIAGEPSSAIARRGIGIKMQVPSVFEGLHVHENLRLAARRKHDDKGAHRVVDDVLTTMRLSECAGRIVSSLSHGERALVELSTALAGEPDLLLLDEPTAGMTKDEVARTAKIIKEISRSRSVVIVEHDMNFIKMMASRVTVFHQGQILLEDSVDNVLRNPVVRDVYLGRQAQA